VFRAHYVRTVYNINDVLVPFFNLLSRLMIYIHSKTSMQSSSKEFFFSVTISLCVANTYISVHVFLFLCVFGETAPQWARASFFTRFLDHTQRRTTLGRTPLDEWLARRTDLYLTTRNTQNRQTSMPPGGFEPTISAGERPQTYALDRAATWTGICSTYCN